VFKAGKEHVGRKNRCLSCGTKFIIPSHEDEDIEVLERGEARAPKAPQLQVQPPKTVPLLVPGEHASPEDLEEEKEEAGKPRKLLTSSDPLRASINAPGRKLFKALPSLAHAAQETEGESDQAATIEPGQKLLRRAPTRKNTTRKHSLEHLPALAPDPPESSREDHPTDPSPTGPPTTPLDTDALLDAPRLPGSPTHS